MIVCHLLLQAKAPEKNLFRSYHIAAGQNLFGDWIVELTYGRIGAKGRTQTLLAADEAEARQLVKRCLKRRRTAPKRHGVPYQLVELKGDWPLEEIFP